jgi:hypothetical protein
LQLLAEDADVPLRLARGHHVVARRAQSLRRAFELRRFAGAVRPLESDKQSRLTSQAVVGTRTFFMGWYENPLPSKILMARTPVVFL